MHDPCSRVFQEFRDPARTPRHTSLLQSHQEKGLQADSVLGFPSSNCDVRLLPNVRFQPSYLPPPAYLATQLRLGISQLLKSIFTDSGNTHCTPNTVSGGWLPLSMVPTFRVPTLRNCFQLFCVQTRNRGLVSFPEFPLITQS